MVVDGGTHQDDSDLWVKTDDPFDCEEDKVCIDISFVNLVKYNERVFIEEFSAMNQSLQENTVGHKNYSVRVINLGLHTDLVPYLSRLLHLPIKNGMQVHDSYPSGLNTHNF